MIYIYTMLYAFNLYFFIDTLLMKPKYWLQIDIARIFLIVGVILYVYNLFIKRREDINLKYLIIKEVTSFVILFPMLMLFILNIGRENTNDGVVLQQALLVCNVFITGKVFSQYRRKDLFLLTSFIVPSMILLYYYKINGSPNYVLSNLINIFDNDRTRMLFSFNHPNTAGNLISGTIILSIVYLFNVFKENKKLYVKIITIILLVIIDIPLLLMLFNTGSRTSIIYLVVFIVLSLYFMVTNISKVKVRYNMIIKVCIILICGLYIKFNTNLDYLNHLYDINRFSYIKEALSDIKGSIKEYFGLGLIYVGDFPNKEFNFGIESTHVDNYFAYIFFCTGIVGLTVFTVCLIAIGIFVFINMYVNRDCVSNLIPAVFISYIVAGFGEACILYFTFPIGFIFMILYVLSIDDLYYKLDSKKNSKVV